MHSLCFYYTFSFCEDLNIFNLFADLNYSIVSASVREMRPAPLNWRPRPRGRRKYAFIWSDSPVLKFPLPSQLFPTRLARVRNTHACFDWWIDERIDKLMVTRQILRRNDHGRNLWEINWSAKINPSIDPQIKPRRKTPIPCSMANSLSTIVLLATNFYTRTRSTIFL